MITLEDCVAFCGLTEAEILAIAEHEHVPEMAAAALADYLMVSEGPDRVCAIIVDDIRAAQKGGDCNHVLKLLHVLHHFLRRHPQACPCAHPWSSVV